MLDNKQINELSKLITQLLDGTISEDDLVRLDKWLAGSPEALDFYREYMKNSAILKHRTEMFMSGTPAFNNFLKRLSKYEVKAPKSQLESDLKSLSTFTDSNSNNIRNKWSIAGISAVAAIILLFFVINLLPQRKVQVARVTDSIEAKWSGGNLLADGSAISTGSKSYSLLHGLAELNFNNGTIVTIEGPAEFQILNEDVFTMSFGKAYAVVSPEGIGFSICTPAATIVDLGTEFGVEANIKGDTVVQVVKGIVELDAGKAKMTLVGNDAKYVSSDEQTINDSIYDKDMFVRKIDSHSNIVWRSQRKFSLADVIGGGDGFGVSNIASYIDPGNGSINSADTRKRTKVNESNYHLIEQNRLVDGVFVPLGSDSDTIVSSKGHIFGQCPKTSGVYWQLISNELITSIYETAEGSDGDQRVSINDDKYGLGHSNSNGIAMHSNAGITFDLERIRLASPELTIKSFNSLCAISDTVKNTDFEIDSKVVMWVLVDGQPRDSVQLTMTDQSSARLDIELADSDKFLTLIATDGENGTNGDWAFWGDPILIME